MPIVRPVQPSLFYGPTCWAPSGDVLGTKHACPWSVSLATVL